MNYDVQIRPQSRKSLAMKVTPSGVQVLIPQDLAPDSPQVQNFIRAGLAKLKPDLRDFQNLASLERLDKKALLALVDRWAGRLGVQVNRVQLQPMRNKWGSISTAGNLTLAQDLLQLPPHLAEYVVCHELLHLRVPHHNRLYRLLLTRHLPDWREREQELGRWTFWTRPPHTRT